MDEVSLIIRRARRGNSKAIDLSSRSLTSLPLDLLKISTLETLNLSHNMIISLPDSITDLENLTSLDLSYNEITSLPPCILILPLQQLNLTGNPINLGQLYGAELKSRLTALFSNSPQIEKTPIAVKRPGTSGGMNRARPREEEKTEPKASLQGVAQVEYTDVALGDVISQGGFSVVHKATWKGTRVAVKVIVDPVITQDLRMEFENEIAMLNYLRHPNTVLLMAASFKPPHFIMVSEFVPNGTLFDYLHRSREEINIEKKIGFISQICSVLLFYHLSGVVHRDLKSMNVLLDEHYRIKLCDFGLARFKSDLNRGSMQFSGTPAYMAPELFKKQSYDEKVDIFAFGTLIWEILTREVPYDALEPQDIKEKVLRGDLRLDPPLNAPRKLVGLIDMCRQTNAANRPSFEEIAGILGGL
jgi:tRNA A-37 threonylcarbamoyl transferase component Bud32